MKKIKNLSESDFLKVFFAFYTVCFLIAAPLMLESKTRRREFPRVLP